MIVFFREDACNSYVAVRLSIPVVPRKAVAEVSKIGNL